MGTIRPLFVEIPQKQFDLPVDWQLGFRKLVIDGSRIDRAMFQHLENWLRCYVDKLHIASYSANTGLVLRALDIVRNRTAKMQLGYSASRERSLRSALDQPEITHDEKARASAIALDYIASGLLPHLTAAEGGSVAWRGREAVQRLGSMNLNEWSLRCLASSAKSSIELLQRSNTENAAHFTRLNGKMVTEGCPFTFQPDPHMERHFRVEQDALDTLAAAMIVIYQCIGGTPYVPSDGRAPSRFMRFLDAAVAALPHPRPNSLNGAARRIRKFETQHGEGSLNRMLLRECP